MSEIDNLLQKIERREARVGIIGLGYVGLPLALVFHEAGFPVLGFEVDAKKPEMLRAGQSYIKHIGADRVAAVFTSGRTDATTDFDRLAECDAVLICVPTPLGKHREPDLSYIRITAEEIGKRVRAGQLIVLESTTYPGTTREIVVPRLEKSGLKAGVDFFVAFSPEREDPGNEKHNTRTIPKVVGGLDEPSTRAAVALYSASIDHVVPVSSPEVAESAKLLENIFRAVNIALANEMKVVLDRMGIDVWEVIEAAKTKPFGFMPFYPGPGLGGHCIPLDPFYLSWKAAEHGVWARFIELSGEVNASMPRYVIEKTVRALNDRGKSIRGAKVCVLGLSYKADIDDDRESPSFELIELLQERGAEVEYCDPHIPRSHAGRKHNFERESVPCTAESFAQFDALVVSTAHAAFKDQTLYTNAQLVIDTRNVIAPEALPGGRVVKA
ncbi:MAG TPA: nucleotide sugar dehydrogenase [Thermoanaerobaculia bacterium]|nr:nucleotide sugar dehydrogenase [Thermoanaerobaculia bacterium]